MTPDLSTTNLWLAILAIASAGQFLMLVAAALIGMRIYKRATNSLDVLEHEHVRPMMLRINALIEDVQDITARARMVDDALRACLAALERRAACSIRRRPSSRTASGRCSARCAQYGPASMPG